MSKRELIAGKDRCPVFVEIQLYGFTENGTLVILNGHKVRTRLKANRQKYNIIVCI